MRKKALWLIFVVLFTLPVVYPYVLSGYPKTHDGTWAVIRLAEMHREIRDVQIPPVWSGYLNHGFGYPLFLFTYPLPYYVGEFIHLLGINVVDATKILFIVSTLISALGMFLLSEKLFGTWGGLISSVAYLYAPYRLLNLFVRGSLGEIFAWMFYPLLFLSGYNLSKKPTKIYFLINSILICLLILSHNASAVLFFPFYIFWLLFLVLESKIEIKIRLLYIVGSFFLGLLCASYFWLPALVEKQYVALSQSLLADKQIHFVSLSLLLGNGIHQITGTKLHLGIVHLLLLVCASFGVFIFLKDHTLRKKSIFLVFSFLFSLFFLFQISYPFWQMPIFSEIDFPWRMLGVSIFLLSLTIGVLGKLPLVKYTSIFILLIIVFFNLGYIYVGERLNEAPNYYETNDGTTTSNDELMPIWVSQKPKNRQNNLIISESLSSTISQVVEKSQNINFALFAKEADTITINKLYFPNWTLYINTIETPMKITESSGLISFFVEPGNYQITLVFKNTTTRIIANVLSALGFCSIVLLLWWRKNFPLF